MSLFGGVAQRPRDGSGGVGSGFVLNGDGEIATNAHVVTTGEVPNLREAREVYVEFADGNQVEAEVQAATTRRPTSRCSRSIPKGLTLRPLPLGDSTDVEVGTPVAAIGSPFSERQSLSVGVVSAVDRSIAALTAFQISGAIQTDAAINPGNSGGPLVDGDGKVIGINQQIKTNSGGGEGVGFAVPVDVARRSLDQLRAQRRGVATRTSASRPSRSTRSCASASTCPVGEGAWVQRVDRGRAGRGGGAARRRRGARRLPGAAATARAAT